jgi:predicted secreted Zn-dependent protease
MSGHRILATLIALLISASAAVSVSACTGGGNSPQPQVSPTAINTQPPAPPTEPPPSPTPLSVGATAALPDRDSCDEIRDTPYRSASEREFFLANCIEQTSSADNEPTVNAISVGADTSEGCAENVEIVTSRTDQTYDVTGVDLDEIADSLDANAPQIEGSTAYGLTEYSYELDGTFCVDGDGSCRVGEVTIAADVTVTQPNLTTVNQLSDEVLEAWTQYAEQVAVHEGRHVRILEEGLESIKADLLALERQPDCPGLNHVIDMVWTLGGGQIEQRQRAFHAADAQGQGGLVVE